MTAKKNPREYFVDWSDNDYPNVQHSSRSWDPDGERRTYAQARNEIIEYHRNNIAHHRACIAYVKSLGPENAPPLDDQEDESK